MKDINKRELNFIKPAVLYGWKIGDIYNGVGYWTYDKDMPVKCGIVAESLINKGYLFRLGMSLVPTAKCFDLRCSANGCHGGALYNDQDEKTGKCPSCNGSGLAFE